MIRPSAKETPQNSQAALEFSEGTGSFEHDLGLTKLAAEVYEG